MQVNGTLFNVELIDVLTELKAQLAANGVQRFSRMFDSGEDVMTQCPYHKGGQERRPSAGIRKSDGLLHCLACGKTVGIDEMIANCFGRHDPVWGYQWLTKNFVTVSVQKRGELKLDLSREKPKISVQGPQLVSNEELDLYRYTHPYLYKRGLTDEIIELFDIGYDKKTDSITFPVKNIFGECEFIARRAVKTKKFDIPKGVDKPLYGLYEYTQMIAQSCKNSTYADEVYLCEGLFDGLRLWCNHKFAFAGFGCLYNPLQIKQLEQIPSRKLVLAFDNDKYGKEGAERIRKLVKNKLITTVIIPSDKHDIGDLTDEEIQNLNEVFA